MLARRKTVKTIGIVVAIGAAIGALLPALAIAAPPTVPTVPTVPPGTVKPKPRKPAPKKPAEPPPPAPAEPPADKPVDAPAPAAAVPASTAGVSSGSPAASEPAAKPGSGDAEPAKADATDVDSLRQEYLSLRDELFKSRARANAVASQLYSTRIQIKLTYTTARFYNPAKSSIRLDGASVYEDAGGAIATDDGIRFDGYVAPGRHLVTFRVEATGKDDDTFGSTTESQIVVKAVAGKDLVVAAKARDSGDIAYAWKKTEVGSYGLGIDVAVTTAATIATSAAAGAKK